MIHDFLTAEELIETLKGLPPDTRIGIFRTRDNFLTNAQEVNVIECPYWLRQTDDEEKKLWMVSIGERSVKIND